MSENNIKVIIDNQEYNALYRTFKSERTGYGVYGKQMINNKQYQLSINIIEL